MLSIGVLFDFFINLAKVLSGDGGIVTAFCLYFLVTTSIRGIGEGCVEVLHSAGADLNKKEWRGRTPLHFAAMGENCEVVCYLLKHGCDANVLDVDLCTPLFYACKNGRWKNIKALIHGGADTNLSRVIFSINIGTIPRK
jgi:ankyrin repeat protein